MVESRTIESVVDNNEEAINLVNELRQRIDAKESEIAHLREIMQQSEILDIDEASKQLSKLQSSFDQVRKLCADRLRPVELEFNKSVASVAGRRSFIEAVNASCAERRAFSDKLAEFLSKTTSELRDVQVRPITEAKISAFLQDLYLLQTDVEKLKRETSLGSFAEKSLFRLNEALQRQFADAQEREQKAERRARTARKDLEVRCETKKYQPLNEEYLAELKESEKLALDLQRAKKCAQLLRDDVIALTTENRNLVDATARRAEELIDLEKYLPDASGSVLSREGQLRNLLCAAEIERDGLQVTQFVIRNKCKMAQQRLQTIQSKLEELPEGLKKRQNDLAQCGERRDRGQEELEGNQAERAELMSQKEFLSDQIKAMDERLKEQRAVLQKLQGKTQKLEVVLRKQMLIRQFNEQKDSLRNCNLKHVAEIVESVLELHGEIGDGELALGSSSSTE
jgi:chromosome segregation ATPase